MVKEILERFTGVKIYRNSIPRGTDVFFDIKNKTGKFRPATIFDVGGHHGETALAFARAFPDSTIYSFEPARVNYEQLVRNCAPYTKIICEHFALGPAKKSERMYLGAESTAFSLADKLNQSTNGPSEDVQVCTIDDVVADRGFAEISILKVDAEGFDLEVLRGGETIIRNGKVPFILMESGFDERFIPIDQCCRYLKERDYDVFGFYDQTPYWWGRNFLWNMNILFIHRSHQ